MPFCALNALAKNCPHTRQLLISLALSELYDPGNPVKVVFVIVSCVSFDCKRVCKILQFSSAFYRHRFCLQNLEIRHFKERILYLDGMSQYHTIVHLVAGG